MVTLELKSLFSLFRSFSYQSFLRRFLSFFEFSRDVNKKSISPSCLLRTLFGKGLSVLLGVKGRESQEIKGKKDERWLFPLQGGEFFPWRDTCVSPSSTCDRHEEGHEVFELLETVSESCLIVLNVGGRDVKVSPFFISSCH